MIHVVDVDEKDPRLYAVLKSSDMVNRTLLIYLNHIN